MTRLEGVQAMLETIKRQTQCQNSAQDCEKIQVLQQRTKAFNERKGELTGYDCPVCKNKGMIIHIDDRGMEFHEICKCMEIRNSMDRINRSGLKSLMHSCTFETYQTNTLWQKNALQEAKNFLQDHDGKWFFFGGQPGAGKTHLCTAIVGQFLHMGYGAHYMLWLDESVKLKALKTQEEAYNEHISKLKTIPVLYIDDFLKTINTECPTDADLRIAYEIINYRYNDSRLITVFSTEKTVNNIIRLDEALGSRILQRTKEYCLYPPKTWRNNYRLSEQAVDRDAPSFQPDMASSEKNGLR